MPNYCVAYCDRCIRHQIAESGEVHPCDMFPDGETGEVLQW